MNKDSVLTLAQKEFSDKLYEPSFIILMVIFTGTIFVYLQSRGGGDNFGQVVRMIAVFYPLIGISLGYDGIIKEKNSKSLNVLLTQPVFRDNIITGKFLGISIILALVVFLSLMIIAASDFLISGKVAELNSLLRLLIFGIFTFLYLLVFASFGLFTSVWCKTEIESLTFGVLVWINMCFAFGPTIIMLASFASGQSLFSMSKEFASTASLFQNISPLHHFAMATIGAQDVSFGGFGVQKEIYGLLDTQYSISYLLGYYWQNIIILIIIPFLFLAASYILFLRDDI
ncbi:MAG: ABC transporter permease [Methanosarcinaceae archaeon]|nr:ABC transporter permease [Methanosarcinaceae archaeon]